MDDDQPPSTSAPVCAGIHVANESIPPSPSPGMVPMDR
jgi:hypothetical protein